MSGSSTNDPGAPGPGLGGSVDRIELDGLGYAVHRAGRLGGPPLLALHGFTGGGAGWTRHLGPLADRFELFAPDLPGHGETETPVEPARASVEHTAYDLAILQGRLGRGPLDLLGYSLGARVALRLAVVHPGTVRRLVLESPSTGMEDPAERAARRAADEALARSLDADGLEPFLERWEAQPIFASQTALPPDARAFLGAERAANRAAGLAVSLRGAGQGTMEPLASHLARLHVPTLVIAGELDPIGLARADAIAVALPNASLAVVPDAGHRIHLESPAAWRRLIADFLLEEPA